MLPATGGAEGTVDIPGKIFRGVLPVAVAIEKATPLTDGGLGILLPS